MPDTGEDTAATSRELERLYRWMAPLYDPFRAAWSRWTRSAEQELDRLFAERIGAQTRILELAPGTGVNIVRLHRCAPDFASYLGIDISADMLERARPKTRGDSRIELRLGDATTLEGVEGPFDFVVCTWLLSHLDDPVATATRALETLAPGGSGVFLFLTEPENALVRALVGPVMRGLHAPFLDPEPIGRIPGLERMTPHGGGIATLAVFRRSG